MDAVDLVVERLHAIVSGLDNEVARVEAGLRRAVAEPEWGALYGRRQIQALVRLVQELCLVRDGEEAAAAIIGRDRLAPG